MRVVGLPNVWTLQTHAQVKTKAVSLLLRKFLIRLKSVAVVREAEKAHLSRKTKVQLLRLTMISICFSQSDLKRKLRQFRISYLMTKAVNK